MPRRNPLAPLAAVTLASVLAGCGSILFTFDPTSDDTKGGEEYKENRIFAGTRFDIRVISAPFTGEAPGTDMSFWGFYPYFFIDLPLSFVADTLFLPYTVPLYYYKTKQQSPKPARDTRNVP
jgi:uncharacterized protein YceK